MYKFGNIKQTNCETLKIKLMFKNGFHLLHNQTHQVTRDLYSFKMLFYQIYNGIGIYKSVNSSLNY